MKLEHYAEIEEIERRSGGKLSVAFRNLGSGETVFYRSDALCKTASIIKLSILVHVALCVEEGSISWGEKLELTVAEKVGGSGVLTQLGAGLELSLRDVAVLMTIISDNTATNMLVEKFGVAPINDRMRAFGLAETTLYRKSYSPDTEESREFGLGKTTAEESLALVTLIAEGRVGARETSAEILSILAEQNYQDGIPRYLPSGWRYSGKTGAVDAVRNDVGLVVSPKGERFALSVFCQDLQKVQWTPENPGLLAIAEVSKALLRPYFD